MTAYVFKKAAQVRNDEADAALSTEGDPAAQRVNRNQLSKAQQASSQPNTLGQVSRGYANAMFLQATSTRFRGLPSVMALGLVGAALFAAVLIEFGLRSISDDVLASEWASVAFLTLPLSLCLMMFTATVSASVRIFRIDIFGPKDIPIVFNRKTRKVYRLVQHVSRFPSSNNWVEFVASLRLIPRYWMAAFRPWSPMLLIEYDWDALQAEGFVQTRLVGKVLTQIYVLQLVALESPASVKAIGGFTLASPLTTGQTTAMDLWEHIRRFMEQNGPQLSAGDKPAPSCPKTFFQSANLVMPAAWPLPLIGSGWTTWQFVTHGFDVLSQGRYEGFAVFAAALLSDFLSALFVFNWLAHKLGEDIELPPELMIDAGERVDLHVLVNKPVRSKR